MVGGSFLRFQAILSEGHQDQHLLSLSGVARTETQLHAVTGSLRSSLNP